MIGFGYGSGIKADTGLYKQTSGDGPPGPVHGYWFYLYF